MLVCDDNVTIICNLQELLIKAEEIEVAIQILFDPKLTKIMILSCTSHLFYNRSSQKMEDGVYKIHIVSTFGILTIIFFSCPFQKQQRR